MRDKDLYAQILGIKSPWQVSSVELALSEGEVTVQLEQEDATLLHVGSDRKVYCLFHFFTGRSL